MEMLTYTQIQKDRCTNRQTLYPLLRVSQRKQENKENKKKLCFSNTAAPCNEEGDYIMDLNENKKTQRLQLQ